MELVLCGISAFLGAAIGAALVTFMSARKTRLTSTGNSTETLPFVALEESMPSQRRPYHRVPQTETEMRKRRGEEPE